MLSKSIEKIFAEQDKKLQERRREFDAEFILVDEKWAANRSNTQEFKKDLHEEIKSFTRWSIGAILAVGLGLALYMTILISVGH